VVLHGRGIAGLPAALHSKARVILQSANRRRPLGKTGHHLNVVVAGHLRSEKSPETIFATAQLLRNTAGIRLIHIGKALDPERADQATATMQACTGYRWRGALPHDAVRDAIQRAHVLVHPSRMEGGANVVIEAITSGTPVLASAVDGNIGLLGEDYPGYFPWGDAPSLAAMLTRLRLELTTGNALLRQLTPAIAARAPLFEPEHERQCVRQLVTDLHRR
jgi:glycosyltransferase involved in cell wall biosynthesis